MKNKALIILVILVVVVIGLAATNSRGEKTSQTNTRPELEKSGVKSQENSYELATYPKDQVPLYKLTKVSSFKLYNNSDPKNTSVFDETDFTYYSVVFDTQASQKEFLGYYSKLFEEKIEEEYGGGESVKGVIGDYKIKATHFGEDTKTGYLEVHLIGKDMEVLESYFADYSSIVEEGQYLTEHEKSYGLLNQKGGEVEYTKYFTITETGDQDQDGTDDADEIGEVEKELTSKFEGKPSYSFDKNSGTMTFEEGEYKVTVVVSKNHRRVYLMQRKSMADK